MDDLGKIIHFIIQRETGSIIHAKCLLPSTSWVPLVKFFADEITPQILAEVKCYAMIPLGHVKFLSVKRRKLC